MGKHLLTYSLRQIFVIWKVTTKITSEWVVVQRNVIKQGGTNIEFSGDLAFYIGCYIQEFLQLRLICQTRQQNCCIIFKLLKFENILTFFCITFDLFSSFLGLRFWGPDIDIWYFVILPWPQCLNFDRSDFLIINVNYYG